MPLRENYPLPVAAHGLFARRALGAPSHAIIVLAPFLIFGGVVIYCNEKGGGKSTRGVAGGICIAIESIDHHRRLVEGGVSGYTLDDCLRDYRLSLLQRFRALVSTIAVMPFTPAERQMHVDVLLPRNIAAILDMDADFVDLN